MLTVSGAYGRDYTSKKQIQADWDADKDFIVRGRGGSGYINRTDARAAGLQVRVRYANDRKVTGPLS